MTSEDLFGSYEFEVGLEGVTVGFSKVSNMEAKVDYDTINEGGNDRPILLPKPRRQADVVTFEKGMVLSDPQTKWNKLKPGVRLGQIIITIKRNGSMAKTLYIDEGLVIQKEYPMLDALSNSLYVEKLQIAHSGIRE